MYKRRFPKFELASPKYYSEMLDPVYQKVKLLVKKQIQEDNPEAIAISLDGWSQYHNNFLGVNIHYIDKNWARRKFNISMQKFNTSHTSMNIKERVQEITEDFDITSKVKTALRDNAANVAGAFKGNDSKIKGIPCLAHTLQLVINDEVFQMASVKTLLKKCRDLCSFANRSTDFYTELKKQELIQINIGESDFLNLPHSDTATRWNSSYYLVERVLKLKPALVSVLASKVGQRSEIEFQNSDWELMEKIQRCLSNFESATKTLQYKDASISVYIPVVFTIIDDLENITSEDQGIKTMKRDLLANMRRRFHDIENHDEYVIATYLDPRWKGAFFRKSSSMERARSFLKEKMKQEVEESLNVTDKSESDPFLNNESGNSENSFEKKLSACIKSQAQHIQIDDLEFQISESLRRYELSPALPQRKSALLYWKTKEEEVKKPWVKVMANLAKKCLTPLQPLLM